MIDIHIDDIPNRVFRREQNRRGLFDPSNGTGFVEAIETSLASLNAYATNYPHWVITYSGGKDSSAVVSFVIWAIEQGHVPRPESLTVLYVDTLMELPPLSITADLALDEVRKRGYIAQRVEPRYLERFWVSLLGRGLPPPRLQTRWCTRTLKQAPMDRVMKKLQTRYGEESTLFITGVRMGESQARDERITTSCSTDDGECGQGWFQQQRHALAPLLDWRVCWVWKWIYSQENIIPAIIQIEPVYEADDVVDIRTGCIGCNLVQYDWALHYLVKNPKWAHLAPFLRLHALYEEMRKPQYRLRRDVFVKKDGTISESKSQQLGPLTIAARQYFFSRVRALEDEAGYRLISDREETLIRRLWRWNVYPAGWTGEESPGNELFPKALIVNGNIIGFQAILPGFDEL